MKWSLHSVPCSFLGARPFPPPPPTPADRRPFDLVSGHTSSPSPRRARHSWPLLTHLPFNASSSGVMEPLAFCLLRTQHTGGVGLPHLPPRHTTLGPLEISISLGSRLHVYRNLKFQMTRGRDPSSSPLRASLPGFQTRPRDWLSRAPLCGSTWDRLCPCRSAGVQWAM